jgi:AcrR family transcriptional regulator
MDEREDFEGYLKSIGVTIADVARVLDMSRTTVYSYIKDKNKRQILEDAVKAVLQERHKRASELISSSVIDSPHGTNITGNKNKVLTGKEENVNYKELYFEQKEIVQLLREQVEFYRAKCKE